MKQRNRILSLMLAILLVVGMLPISTLMVSAAVNDIFDDPASGLRFKVLTENGSIGTVSVEDGSYTGSSYTIPKEVTHNGIVYTVTEIGVAAFSGCTELISITIPDSVTIIRTHAFQNTRLTSVTIPDSVTTIDTAAFRKCITLTSVTIPSSVTTIGDAAFIFCDSLQTVLMITGSPKTIGESAFMDSPVTFTYKYATPQNLRFDGKILRWDDLGLGYVRYKVKLKNPTSASGIVSRSFTDYTNSNSYDLSGYMTQAGTYEFEVTAVLPEILSNSQPRYQDSETVIIETEYPFPVELPSVQVGKATLYDGEYTTDGQSTTTTKPESGGYAHFENGVLTLNNFTYSGGGNDYAAIYSVYPLTIKVEGNNSITRVVTATDTDTLIVLRGIWVRSGELKIIGDDREDFLEVIAYGHENTTSYAVNGNSEGVVIENCTLEAKSATGGAGLYVAGDVSITGADVLGSSGSISVNRDTFGIYAATLEVKDSKLVAVAENNSNDGANGLWIAGSEGKLIFESGSIVAETSDVSDDSYAIHIATNDVTLPAKYWMRTSASDDFVEGTWDGANVGPYIELTTAKQSGSIANISEMDKVYDGSAVEAPTVNALSTGAKTFKYKVKGADDSTYTTEAPTNAGEYTCLITVAADDNYTEATATKDFVISRATPTAPTTPVGVNTTYIDTTDGKITGVDSTMEYRKDGETNYTAVTGTEITNLAAGTYYVRYAETANYNPSPDKVITISLGGKRTPIIDINPTASRVIIGGKLSDSTLTGGVASVDGEFTWKDGTEVLDNKGTVQKTVVFTPDDTATYNTVEFDVDVTVVICDTTSGEHEYTEQENNADEHWIVCAKCGIEEPDSREAHKGGTATCTAKAKCSECGEEYGAEPSHGETEIRNAETATCDEEGYTGDKHCKVCGEKLADGTVIAKTAHTYENGKCTVCGAADPDYVPDSPQTGDNSNMALWVALLFISGMGLVGTTVYGRKKRTN